MNFTAARAIQRKLEAECARHSATLREYKKDRHANGMTPDRIKLSHEYRATKAAYDNAFQRLRQFNGWFTRTFRAEILAAKRAA